MGESTLPEVSHLHLLGLDISSITGWEVYISGIAKSASMPVSCLYRAQKFLPPDMPEATLYMYLYKTTIQPPHGVLLPYLGWSFGLPFIFTRSSAEALC